MELSTNQQITKEDDIYAAMAYYRLSKEDGDSRKNVSDSIANQRVLVLEYVRQHPNIKLVGEAYDDGYTGTNYDRPGFKKVMDAIKIGKVNCVIVKDLSRLGREYIETGKYLEQVFPSMGVRFIAINDDVDSMNAKESDDILIPVRNIMNESYCRELSKKLRRQFKIQRLNGEYIGAFACYGYRKDPKDKHKLVIDEYAAEIVRSIFTLKIKGYSQQSIADFLNRAAILPPAEYKRNQGLNYKSGFKGSGDARWNPYTISKILVNPVYIGTLIQGKRGTPNYKIKEMHVRDEEQWCVVPNNHEPIIDEHTFNSVQRALSRDTRVAPTAETVDPLSGMIFCADCGRAMVKRSVSRGNKKFNYYVCSTNKKGNGCSSHSVSKVKLENTVMRAVRNQINLVVEMQQLIGEVNRGEIFSAKQRRLDVLIAQKNQEIDKQETFRMKLYEALNEGLIDRNEYDAMRKHATEILEAAEAAVRKLDEERSELISKNIKNLTWMEAFANYQSVMQLSREMVVAFIDKVTVYEDKTIHIDFNYRDEFASYQGILNKISREVS
jgi:DNA invertase Pin-like site-specific DNA recombinase